MVAEGERSHEETVGSDEEVEKKAPPLMTAQATKAATLSPSPSSVVDTSEVRARSMRAPDPTKPYALDQTVL